MREMMQVKRCPFCGQVVHYPVDKQWCRNCRARIRWVRFIVGTVEHYELCAVRSVTG